MAVIGTRALSSGDASRKNSEAELQKRMDLQWVSGEIKIRRDWAGPQFLFFFAQGIKFSPAFGRGDVLPDCCYGLKGGCCE
jgi:hypothetical protein